MTTIMPPLELPQLTTAEATYFTMLSRHAAPIRATVGGHGWTIALDPAPAAEAVPDGWRVSVDFGGTRLAVDLAPGVLEEVLQALDPGGEPSVLPPVLRQALTELAFADLADALQAACGHAVRVLAVDAADPAGDAAAPHRIGLQLARSGGGRTVYGLIGCDARGLAMIADLVSRSPRSEPSPEARSDLPVPLRLEVGRTTLPFPALRDLAHHDVILLDDSRLVAEDRLVLRLSTGTGLVARIAGSTLVIEDILRTPLMTDAPDASAAVADAATSQQAEPLLGSLDEVEVVLTFDLGEQCLTLADLRTLAPGAVFDLGRDPRRAVNIRANGKLVGTGALVQVDDRVGVCVGTLAGRGE